MVEIALSVRASGESIMAQEVIHHTRFVLGVYRPSVLI